MGMVSLALLSGALPADVIIPSGSPGIRTISIQMHSAKTAEQSFRFKGTAHSRLNLGICIPFP
ncbi:hypothetical protein D3C71_2016460 [compost metagenome]